MIIFAPNLHTLNLYINQPITFYTLNYYILIIIHNALKKLIYKFMRDYDVKSPINKLSIGYEAYLNSEQWAEKRRQTIIYHGVKCKDCGDNAIDIHHLHYNTLYFEDPKKDLIPLCRECHSKRHGHD